MAEEQTLLIRFRGICAHIDLPNGNGNGTHGAKKKVKKRTVLVRGDHRRNNIEHHIPFIEFYADDLDHAPRPLRAIPYTRPASDSKLARIELPEGAVEIRIKGLAPGLVEEDANYEIDVPHVVKVVEKLAPEVQVKASLLGPTKLVDPNLVCAVMDLPAGRLMAGEPEAVVTKFHKDVGFASRRLARWTDLHVQIPAPLVLEIIPLADERAKQEIVFKRTTRMIVIGNEPRRLIVGLFDQEPEDHVSHGINHASVHDPLASPPQPTGHYVMYYDLIDNPPPSRPVPIPTQTLGTGCPNGNLP